jgi:hypothetical protein
LKANQLEQECKDQLEHLGRFDFSYLKQREKLEEWKQTLRIPDLNETNKIEALVTFFY